MKLAYSVIAAFLLGAAPIVASENEAPELRLAGIVSFSSNRLALLHLSAPAPKGGDADMVLGKGERDGDVEVVDIDETGGRVKARIRQQSVELSFTLGQPAGTRVSAAGEQPTGGPLRQPASIRLEEAGLDQVLALYQMVARRSLIRPAALPKVQLSVYSATPVTTGALLSTLEQALSQQGIQLRAEGDKFSVALAAGAPDYITPEVRDAAAELAKVFQGSPSTTSEIPAGAINFPRADLNQVLVIFQDLANRTAIRPMTLPSPVISFRTYSPLTYGEAVFAFTGFLAANGISVLPAGEKLMVVFPNVERRKVTALLQEKHAAATSAMPSTPPRSINWGWADLDQALALYREVSGRTVEVSSDLPRRLFTLRNQTSLSPSEVLTALDLLLGVNGLKVVPGNDGTSARLVAIQADHL